MSLKPALLPLLAMLLAVPAPAQEALPPDCEIHLVTVNAAGEAVAGTKAALTDAINRGRPIRIGFRFEGDDTPGYYLTHWYEPRYLTPMGDEVYTHASKVHLQMTDPDALPPEDRAELWLSLIGTDGGANARYTQGTQSLARKAESWWCTIEE